MNSFNDGKDQDLLNWARQGNASLVNTLLAKGADINTTTSGGLSALHLAASGGHWAVVEELLTTRPVADINLAAEGGRTPLMAAMQTCNERVISLLLTHGAAVNATDRENWTALHMAAVKGKREAVEQLLNAGADFMAIDFLGRTPAAVAKENSGAAELLAEKEKQFRAEQNRREQKELTSKNIDKLDQLMPRRPRP